MGRNLLFFFVLAMACGGPSESSDAGMDAASLTDSGSSADAGGPGEDAATATDSGIDCSTIGCGAPVACTETCTAPCGCCPCGDGEEIEIDGRPHVCSGGCWALRGDLIEGEQCAMTSECGEGLSCCYPCGIPGCTNVCEPTCTGGDPCFGGCLLRP